MKRFYVDLSVFGRGTTGVNVYAVNLAQRLQAEFDCQVIAPADLAGRFTDVIECPPPLRIRNSVVGRNHLAAGWRRIDLGGDTFVYAPHMRALYPKREQVVTVHDLIHHYHRTRNVVENAYNDWLLPRLLPRLPAVFTISQTVRAELCAFYGLSPERVAVVPNGIDLQRWRPAPPVSSAEPPYLLVVSANRPYKNTVELLRQHALWAADYRLKIVSWRSRYGGVVQAEVARLGLGSRVDFLEHLAEESLIDLYRGAAAIVYPSLMEGFGRPALEAMAVGRPVILSDIPVHRESFAEAALFVTPGDAASWRDAFARLHDAEQVAGCVTRGLTVAQRFSWERAGDTLVAQLLRVAPGLRRLRR